jgi:hypothetical protein
MCWSRAITSTQGTHSYTGYETCLSCLRSLTPTLMNLLISVKAVEGSPLTSKGYGIPVVSERHGGVSDGEAGGRWNRVCMVSFKAGALRAEQRGVQPVFMST